MRQVNAFPIRLIQVDPVNLGSADAAFFGAGDNGLEYCVKTEQKTAGVPAAEWICHSIALSAGLAVPQCDIVVMSDGSHAFGSVWDASAATDRQETIRVLMGSKPGREISRTLTRIYALDLFLHNGDRHAGNYLCVGGRTNTHSLKAFDFSRAFTAIGWPLPPPPLPIGCNTMVTVNSLKRFHRFEASVALEFLDRLEQLSFAWFRSMVDALPRSWMTLKMRNAVLQWWPSERVVRLNHIREGFKNGSL